ncbi:substrate-binding domain-containing protein [Sphingobacterium sp. DK4209]|uniref:Substrate-binding domain-containing protein n=1 Tax=Sphingobacterium zhuxiongii TaxID=2662364 RepID=A0A5Q0QFH7_9SPHI|nr:MULTISPECIES: LacI family DNA-binding transcriptional regulator [unclassified Sphingobacterium]MVZ66138.1 substrate-binding domain-containing protein [Sphingobacterium sp. DK4209]QGA26558.1 substrate-binding domain-containing protein [Sphingobacterium sp. dk4302]
MYKPITIKDIARALAISPSTVSRALSDSYEINELTKKRILDYAEEHKYKRNPIASSLRHGRSYSIGVVVCEVANSFFSQAINGIESVAYAKGYHVIISQSHDAYEREVMNIQHLANRSVDGLLISMSAETTDFSHIVDLHGRGLPFVFFDRIINEFETHTVTVNNREGARKATQSLIDKGFRHIVHLANAPHLSITAERLEGFKDALRDNQLPYTDSLVRYCHHGGRLQEEIEDAVAYYANLDQKVDAIFVASDRLSMGCIQAYHQLQPVAQHPAIAGFSNSDSLNMLQPDFTCVRQPAFEMGRAATEKLIQLIESRYPVYHFENIVLETEIITH